MANQKLPGIQFFVRDGGLTPAVPTPTSNRLLIIGPALDGPTDRAVIIRTLEDALDIYGPQTYRSGYRNPITATEDGSWAGNELIKSVNEALLGGAGTILLCRVGGTTAVATNTLSASLTVTSVNPGRIYNGVQLVASSGSSGYTISLVQPSKKGGTQTFSFDSNKTIGDMVNTINSDQRNQSVILSVPQTVVTTNIMSLGVGTVTITGATNGTAAPGEDLYTSKNTLYTNLTQSYGTFDNLIDTEFDVAVLAGIYGDDQVVDTGAATTTSIAQAFGEFLYKVSKETKPCCGVLGLRPTFLRTPSELNTIANNNYLNTSAGYYNQNARWINFGYFMNAGFSYTDVEENEVVDIGRYLSIVAGPDIILKNSELGPYVGNGAVCYAGMIVNLPAQSASTNKPLGSIKGINGIFPKATHELLNQGVGRNLTSRNLGSAAYVTFKQNTTIGLPIVVADNTASSRSSDFATLQVLKIVNLATALTKLVMYPFIGEPNNIESRNAMRTQLTSALNKMVESGALLGGDNNGFQFTISSDPVQMLLGEITITLFLRPALQIKQIRVVVSVTQ